MRVWVKPKLHTHQECGPRFLPLLHTYSVDCLATLVGEDVSSRCCVQWEIYSSPGLNPVKDRHLALVPRQGPEISSVSCLWVSPRPRHRARCWLINQSLNLLRISCLEAPRAGWGPRHPRTQPPLASSSAISLPRTLRLILVYFNP